MASFSTLELRGYLVGSLWWPVGGEAWKALAVNLKAEAHRYSSKPTLRDLVLDATNDGDFAGGGVIAQGEIIATRVRIVDGRRFSYERRFPLSQFASVADCLHGDPDWWPIYPDEIEEAA